MNNIDILRLKNLMSISEDVQKLSYLLNSTNGLILDVFEEAQIYPKKDILLATGSQHALLFLNNKHKHYNLKFTKLLLENEILEIKWDNIFDWLNNEIIAPNIQYGDTISENKIKLVNLELPNQYPNLNVFISTFNEIHTFLVNFQNNQFEKEINKKIISNYNYELLMTLFSWKQTESNNGIKLLIKETFDIKHESIFNFFNENFKSIDIKKHTKFTSFLKHFPNINENILSDKISECNSLISRINPIDINTYIDAKNNCKGQLIISPKIFPKSIVSNFYDSINILENKEYKEDLSDLFIIDNPIPHHFITNFQLSKKIVAFFLQNRDNIELSTFNYLIASSIIEQNSNLSKVIQLDITPQVYLTAKFFIRNLQNIKDNNDGIYIDNEMFESEINLLDYPFTEEAFSVSLNIFNEYISKENTEISLKENFINKITHFEKILEKLLKEHTYKYFKITNNFFSKHYFLMHDEILLELNNKNFIDKFPLIYSSLCINAFKEDSFNERQQAASSPQSSNIIEQSKFIESLKENGFFNVLKNKLLTLGLSNEFFDLFASSIFSEPIENNLLKEYFLKLHNREIDIVDFINQSINLHNISPQNNIHYINEYIFQNIDNFSLDKLVLWEETFYILNKIGILSSSFSLLEPNQDGMSNIIKRLMQHQKNSNEEITSRKKEIPLKIKFLLQEHSKCVSKEKYSRQKI